MAPPGHTYSGAQGVDDVQFAPFSVARRLGAPNAALIRDGRYSKLGDLPTSIILEYLIDSPRPNLDNTFSN